MFALMLGARAWAADQVLAPATAAGPSYLEGTVKPLSQDLSGNLRIICVAGCGGSSGSDVTDRAGRLLGIVYGSQGQQVQQTATNFNLKVEEFVGGTAIDARQIRALTTADSVNIGQWLGSTAPTVGVKTGANSLPVVLASDQAAVPISGTVTANAGTNLNTSALLLDATFTGRINTQGQKTMAGSTPVVLASDQAQVPITAASLPLPANAAQETGGALAAIQAAVTGTLSIRLAPRQLLGPLCNRVRLTNCTPTGGF